METSDFLIQLLGEDSDTNLVLVLGQRDLSNGLVGERARHDERGVTSGATQVHQTSTSKEDDGLAVLEGELVNLRLDLLVLDGGIVLKTSDINLVIEVTDVANNGVVAHLLHVSDGDDVLVTGGGDVDISTVEGVLEGVDLISGHGGLEGTDGIDLGDDDTSTLTTERVSTTLGDITETADNSGLTTDHDISSTVDTINQRVTATVDVVELGLGDRVVDVDGGEEELAITVQLVETGNTSGGLLRDTLDLGNNLVEVSGLLLQDTLEDGVNNLDLSVATIFLQDRGIVLSLVPTEDEKSSISSIINNKGGSEVTGPADGLPGALPVLLKGLSLPGKDRRGTSRSNGSSGVVLSGVDVARAPPELSTERGQSLDQDSGLDGHVEGTSQTVTFQRLVGVLDTGLHQTRHLELSQVDLTTTELSQSDVSDLVVIASGGGNLRGVGHGELRTKKRTTKKKKRKKRKRGGGRVGSFTRGRDGVTFSTRLSTKNP